MRLCLATFLIGDFWSELDAATDDAMDRGRGIVVLEIGAGIGLSDVGGERAADLVTHFSLEAEIIVPVNYKVRIRSTSRGKGIKTHLWGSAASSGSSVNGVRSTGAPERIRWQ
jgi:hypothetical protein